MILKVSVIITPYSLSLHFTDSPEGQAKKEILSQIVPIALTTQTWLPINPPKANQERQWGFADRVTKASLHKRTHWV
jgi:hypothetical protein